MAGNDGNAFYSDDNYEVRPARSIAEYKDVWWTFMQELGWDRSYYDLETFMNPSIGCGMFLLIDKSTGKPCGHVSAVQNPNSTGWISMYIIDAAHRGKGLGRPLFKAAMADADRNGIHIMGLDGVTEQKAAYERRKFVNSPLGTVKVLMRPLVAREPLPASAVSHHDGGTLTDLRKVPQKLMVQHELKYTGFERPDLWSDKHLFNRPDVSGFALVKTQNPSSPDDLQAWIVSRRCSGGIRLGPLYAQDAASAETVLVAAMESATPEVIKKIPLPKVPMSDLPENEMVEKATMAAEVWAGNPEAIQLFEKLGWKAVGVDYHRMWVDGNATPEQSKGGLAQQGLFAIFDAAVG